MRKNDKHVLCGGTRKEAYRARYRSKFGVIETRQRELQSFG